MEQRLRALSRGHDVRTFQAQMRRSLKAGTMTLAQALEHDQATRVAGTLTVERLLTWMPGVGRRTVPKLLAGARVSPTRLVCHLTERERVALLSAREW